MCFFEVVSWSVGNGEDGLRSVAGSVFCDNGPNCVEVNQGLGEGEGGVCGFANEVKFSLGLTCKDEELLEVWVCGWGPFNGGLDEVRLGFSDDVLLGEIIDGSWGDFVAGLG